MNKKFIFGIAASLALSAAAFGASKDTPAAVSTITAEEISTPPTNEELLKRLEALEEKQKEESQSGWAGKVRVKGDVRYRFQHVEAEDTAGNDLSTTKNIQRIRARLGVYADVNNFTKAAIGMRTGEKANSGNVTIGDGFDSKNFNLSLAYIAFDPEDAKYGTATIGKMKQQWQNTTDMIWDSDVNPEGFAYAYAGKMKNTGLFTSAGYYRVVETATSTDCSLGQIQGGVIQPIGDKLKGTFGVSYYGYDNAKAVALYPVGYKITELFFELGVKDVGPVGINFYGNVVSNSEVDTEDSGYCVGVKFSDANKGKWEAKYDYRDLGLYAAPGAFTDSDFADGGAGVKGSRIKGKYNFAKNLAAGLTYVYSERTPARTTTAFSQQFNSLMLDLMVSF
ncbi:putative porin [Pontiellaceae bacterium B1224]|nr:putative porin [Pontiellaceae bacterium B1224]